MLVMEHYYYIIITITTITIDYYTLETLVRSGKRGGSKWQLKGSL